MIIVAISDTHQKHNRIQMPEGDIFLFAGDMSFFNNSRQHYVDFNNWLGTLPYKHKIIVAGNHDVLFQRDPNLARSLVTNCTYLQDEEIIVEGLKFYGSPWQKWYYDWAFNLPEKSKILKEKWDKIPNDTDVLITHSPPFQILDQDFKGESLGCELLQKRIFEIKPKLHVFGHIHGSGGKRTKIGKTIFANVSGKQPLIIDTEDFV